MNAEQKLAELEERLRALAERWDDYRVPTKPDDPQAVRAFDSGIQSGLSTAAKALRALLGEAAR